MTVIISMTSSPHDAHAQDHDSLQIAQEQKLKECLRNSEQNPDDTKAFTETWIRDGGGDRAKLCRAFSQYYAGDHIFAAQEFAMLAKRRAVTNKKHAAGLYAQAGDAYHKAHDYKSAETSYGLALQMEPQDPEIWRDRGLARAANEKFWDAVEDFNQALKIMPDMAEVLRARGQVWLRLGLESNARADFISANKIDPNDEAQKIMP